MNPRLEALTNLHDKHLNIYELYLKNVRNLIESGLEDEEIKNTFRIIEGLQKEAKNIDPATYMPVVEDEREKIMDKRMQSVALTKTRGYHVLREQIDDLRRYGMACDEEGEDTDALEELANAISALSSAPQEKE